MTTPRKNMFAAGLAGLLAAPSVLLPLRERLEPRELVPGGTFVTARGFEVHVVDEGLRDGFPVLLLHGFGGWVFTWRHLRPALMAAGYRAISVDMLGYGASARPAIPVYTTVDQASVALAALDQLNIDRFAVVGHSFGARVGLQLALDHPQRVRQVVAIAPEVLGLDRPPIGKIVALPLFGVALSYYTLAPHFVGTGLRMLSGDKTWVTPEVVAGYAAPLYVRGSADAQVWQARSPKDGDRPVPNHLGQILQPVDLLWGGADTVFPLSDGEQAQARLPNARFQSFAGAGHLPHEEQPDAVNAAVIDALQRV